MNNIIDMSENNFLVPYYKQFLKLLKSDKILLCENIKTNAYEYFTRKGKIVTNNIDEPLLGGIILNNYLSKMNDDELIFFIKNLYNNLTDECIILVINNANELAKDTLNYIFKNKFEEVEELIGDNKWNFILYQKKTTK